MTVRARTIILFLLAIAIIVLIGVLMTRKGIENTTPPPAVLSDDDRANADRIIRTRINTLSPTPPKLGDRFEVSTIEWDGRGHAVVTYGDHESTLKGVATIGTGSGGKVKIEGFVLKK